MDAVKYLKERERMCDELIDNDGCGNCPLSFGNNGTTESCAAFTMYRPEEAVRIVEGWSAAHPIKTNAIRYEEVFGVKPHKNPGGQWCCPPHKVGGCNTGTICDECRGWWDKPYVKPKGE